MRYHHVVCRDCDLEAVLESRDEAMALWEEHGAETGHRVQCARLQAGEREPQSAT